MGAVLGCCGGPSTDYDAAFFKSSSARYHPLLGRCDAVEKSLLCKLQRSLSTTWSSRLVLGGDAAVRSPHALSHTGSRYGLDEHYESESDSDDEPASRGKGAGSVASATSGSRMLCDFYNLVLECDHSKFFVDASGRRVKGAYLTEVEILDDYFDTTRRTTVGSRRRRRSSVDVLPYQPPQKLKHLGSHPYYDRSSAMSLMSNDTSETLASESDYWATFMDTPEDPIDFLTEMTFPPKYGSTPLQSHGRTRRDSVDRRRPWVQQEQQLFGAGLGLEVATTPSLLLFSPVNATATTTAAHEPAPPTVTRQRSSSRNAMQNPLGKPLAMPIEGSRSNLWDTSADDEAGGVIAKATGLPAAFASAAVSERRRASLTMGTVASGSGNASRRLSLHAIAPIAV